MTNQEITEKLATQVMGWESCSDAWVDPKSKDKPYYIYNYIKSKWQPLTDWNHLMMCVEKVVNSQGKKYRVKFSKQATPDEWVRFYNSIFKINQDPKRAIAEALCKAMEGE